MRAVFIRFRAKGGRFLEAPVSTLIPHRFEGSCPVKPHRFDGACPGIPHHFQGYTRNNHPIGTENEPVSSSKLHLFGGRGKPHRKEQLTPPGHTAGLGERDAGRGRAPCSPWPCASRHLLPHLRSHLRINNRTDSAAATLTALTPPRSPSSPCVLGCRAVRTSGGGVRGEGTTRRSWYSGECFSLHFLPTWAGCSPFSQLT